MLLPRSPRRLVPSVWYVRFVLAFDDISSQGSFTGISLLDMALDELSWICVGIIQSYLKASADGNLLVLLLTYIYAFLVLFVVIKPIG